MAAAAQYNASAAAAKLEHRDDAVDIRPRKLHNLIKADLILRFAGDVVLDLACGRGGDLAKYRQARYYTGIDISPDSVAEAKARSANHHIAVAEVCVDDITSLEPDRFAASSLDTISCMFALHYFWGEFWHVNKLLALVSVWLKPGGVFMGIVPDAEAIMDRAAEAVLGSGSNTFTHPLFTLEFGSAIYATLLQSTSGFAANKYGMSYFFGLPGSGLVQNSLEYLVPMPEFVKMAGAHALELTESQNLKVYYETNIMRDLEVSMRFKGSSLTHAEWQLPALYRTFVFTKTAA